MIRYKIPTELNEEEKIIGGVLTLKQFGYVAVGLIIGIVLFSVFYFLPFFLRVFFIVIFFTGGAVLGFWEIKNLKMDIYLYLYIRYLLSPKKLLYKRRPRLWEH